MEQNQKFLKVINIALWVVQVILAMSFITGGVMKIFMPVEKLAAMWPWTADVPLTLLRFIGILDAFAAVGIVLPLLLHKVPRLAPITALCIVLLMICASVFHVVRGETSSIGINIIFAILAAFVAWGRFKKYGTV